MFECGLIVIHGVMTELGGLYKKLVCCDWEFVLSRSTDCCSELRLTLRGGNCCATSVDGLRFAKGDIETPLGQKSFDEILLTISSGTLNLNEMNDNGTLSSLFGRISL